MVLRAAISWKVTVPLNDLEQSEAIYHFGSCGWSRVTTKLSCNGFLDSENVVSGGCHGLGTKYFDLEVSAGGGDRHAITSWVAIARGQGPRLSYGGTGAEDRTEKPTKFADMLWPCNMKCVAGFRSDQ